MAEFDRFPHRGVDESRSHKLKSAYWTTKQAMIKKFGRKQDENIVASDSDLDAKLALFSSIQTTCRELIRLLIQYQETIYYLSQSENEMGRFLKRYSMENKTQAGKIMSAAGKSLSHSAQQRLLLRSPLDRVLQEVKTFRQRAIADTIGTLKRMEASRTEYRGALLWMKNVSEELDPDTYKQLEKFRCVQAQVRKTKSTFDRLKIDSMQKIDLLSASRCNMLSHALVGYQNSMLTFLEKTSSTMVAVAERFKGYQYYEFSVLKELRPESKKLAGVDDLGEDDVHSAANLEDSSSMENRQQPQPTEEELDRRLDEIFQADHLDNGKSDPFLGSIAADSLNDGSQEFISRTAGGVPEEHRDFLKDIFATDDNFQPNLSSDFGAGCLGNDDAKAFEGSLPDGFESEFNSVFTFKSEPTQSSQQSESVEDDPWSDFQRSASSTMPSHLLDRRGGGATAAAFGETASGLSQTVASSPTTTTGEQSTTKTSNQNKAASLDSWMSLFSDLGQLGNPDLLSKKEGQISDA